MTKLENDFMNTQPLKPLCWMRFIDDIFMIWTHGIDQLNNFLDSLNSFSSLKFTWSISQKTVTFLDIDVFIEDDFLKHKINIKPTNTFQYLHYSSCHPLYVKKSIPKSLATRAKKLCSEEKDVQEYTTIIRNALLARGYPQGLLNDRLGTISRQYNTPKFNNEIPKLITQFHPGLHKLNNVIKIAFSILQNSPLTNNIFKSPPRVVFKRPPTLKDIISKPKLPVVENASLQGDSKGSHPCKKPRCLVCKQIETSETFNSSSTSKTYKIPGSLSCCSTNVVYQIQCKKCPMDYIGSTTNTLRVRMTGHRFAYKHRDETKPLVTHGISHGENFENTFKVKPIRQISNKLNVSSLRRLEQACQLVTESKCPKGLNLR